MNYQNRRAFSIVEVLIAVAALATLTGLAVSSVTGTHASIKAGKLRNDVTTINAAIKVYLASGGDLSEATTADEVLRKLKSSASAERGRRLTGLSSAVIDARLTGRMQSAEEAKALSPRARWNQSKMQFTVDSSGAPGIKEFYFDKADDAADHTDQRAGKLLFAKESGWIWDYQDRAPDVIPGPTVVALDHPTVPPLVPGMPPSATYPGPSSSPTPLAEPVISPSGGSFPHGSFPLAVTLTNPNPPGVSKITYSIDSVTWQDYSAALSIPADTPVLAMAVALEPEWTHSGTVSETYQAEKETLISPVITPSADTFGFFATDTITVTLSNPNPAGVSLIRYRINGAAWQDYTLPFALEGTLYGAAGVIIEAQAVPDDSPFYLASAIAQDDIDRQSITLSGNTDGVFRNPTGTSDMVTNLASGGSTPLFEWGETDNSSHYSESWMRYTGASFADIADGARFEIGELSYYNGTIKSDTGASTIDLLITLTVNVNGQTFRPFFDFTFELVNSPNVSGDDWGSADYVRIVDPRADRTLVFNDYEFEFHVEFGSSSSNGFAAFDEFHVLEDKSASVDVFGTFVNLGLVTDNTSPLEGGSSVATDSDTGTVTETIFQKQGYVDSVEYVTTLGGAVSKLKRAAGDSLGNAEDGLKDVHEGSRDVAKNIRYEKYRDAGKLVAAAMAGAADAEAAAQQAEQAAWDARQAAEQAQLAAASDPTLEQAASEIAAAATQADHLARQARQAANDAANELAGVEAVTDDFKQLVFSEIAADGDACEDTKGIIAGYVEYLTGFTKAQRDNSKSSRDAAESSEADAKGFALKAYDKLNDNRLAKAQQLVDDALAAGTRAAQAAQAAEHASSAAGSAASEAGTIAANYADAAQHAADAADYADQARTFASEARAFAHSAGYAAAEAGALAIAP